MAQEYRRCFIMDQKLSRAETIRLRLVSCSCLNIFWAFIFTIITFTFANSVYAISLSDHVITDNFQSDTTCTKPVEKTNFKTTDSKVYSWVHLSNASPMDRLTWRWIDPDNSVYATVPWTVGVQGSTCAAAWMAISGQPAASKTGSWKTEIYLGNILAATDTFSIGVPEPAAAPKVTFSPPESKSLMGGEVFDLGFQIESSTTPLVTSFSMFYNDVDITQSFFAWLNAGIALVSIDGNLINVTIPQISLPSGLHKVSVIVGNPSGSTTATWSMNMTSPKYNLSDTQKNLVNSYGNPDYLSILFNSDQLRREETWTYVALGKMYLFWDGVQVGEKSVEIDVNLYSNPPVTDPSLFTNKTTLADVINMFGNNYATIDLSSLDPALTVPDLQTHYFEDKGVLASFVGSQPVFVQTIDIPAIETKNMGDLFLTKRSFKSSGLLVGLEEARERLTTHQLVIYSVLAGANISGCPRNELQDILNCTMKCLEDSSTCGEQLNKLVNLLEEGKFTAYANLGLPVLVKKAELLYAGETACDADQQKSGDGITCTEKCTYTYTDYSDCKENNSKTRIADGKSPDGCSGTPVLTEACTYTPPACEFTYSKWSECQSDGYRYRWEESRSPEGCVGEPVEEESCNPKKNCTAWTYSDWSDCKSNGTKTRTATGFPDGCVGDPKEPLVQTCQSCTGYEYTDSECVPNASDRRLGTITRTYRGVPEGCTGNVPPPEYFCCDGLDPC